MNVKRYMECGTVRPNRPCPHMSLDGCQLIGGCQPVLVLCEGCKRIEEYPEASYCAVAPQPLRKWANGKVCNMATHIEREQVVAAKKINPLKASKKARRAATKAEKQ